MCSISGRFASYNARHSAKFNFRKITFTIYGASLVAQMVKNPHAKWETWVQSLGWKDTLLDKGMATHSSIMAWRIPWIEEPRRL